MTDYICCKCGSSNGDLEVTKQRCGHIICWKCLHDYVKIKLNPKIRCPGPNCSRILTDAAIRKVLSDVEIVEYEELMMKQIRENKKCLLEECPHSYICDNTQVQFDCPECSLFNCLCCNAPHKFLSCMDYRSSEEAARYCEEEIIRAKKVLKIRKRERSREMFKELDNEDLIIHDDLLECNVCCRHLARGDAVILRCSHRYCRYCLRDHINATITIPILCQSDECKKTLEEREIFKLISLDELRIYVDRCNSNLKGKLEFTFQCQTPNCVFFVEYTIKPDIVHCPVCNVDNCTKCYAIHPNESCARFKDRIKSTPYGINLLNIEERIRKKELMRCLKCHQILQKISGCSWIQCSNCRFEMCWALQMRRWGPAGRNDTSGGCKCGVDGKYCLPGCGSCRPHNS